MYMISSFLSIAPDNACNPMSAVPPSPAKPTALKSVIPWALNPASTPVSIEAVPAKVEIIALLEKQS